MTVLAGDQGPKVHSGSDSEGGSQRQDMLLPPLPSQLGPMLITVTLSIVNQVGMFGSNVLRMDMHT